MWRERATTQKCVACSIALVIGPQNRDECGAEASETTGVLPGGNGAKRAGTEPREPD